MENIERLYIHFPLCRHLCNYCDFFKKVKTDDSQTLSFHQYLDQSIEHHDQLLKKNNLRLADLSSIFIGGGTPSLWGKAGADYVENLFKKLQIKLKDDCEFTIEVNPGSWKEEDLIAWKSVGVNRFSLGIQSYNQKFIKHLDRIHSLDDVVDTLTFFNQKQLNFSVDFMLGLPFSERDERDVIEELKQVLKFQPNHFSLYILTTKENYVHSEHLPSEDWIEKEYMQVSEFLKEKGYLHYEVSNFAKPGFESTHNLAYWKSESVAAFGPSATGFLNNSRVRYKWKPLVSEFVVENLTTEEFKLEEFYMKFRTNEGLDFAPYFSKEDGPKVSSLLKDWTCDGLINKGEDGLYRLTSMGYFSMDNLMNQLFSHTSSF